MEPRERLTRDIAILEMARMLCKRECVMRHRCDNCHPHSQLFELAGNLLEAAGIADLLRDAERYRWLREHPQCFPNFPGLSEEQRRKALDNFVDREIAEDAEVATVTSP